MEDAKIKGAYGAAIAFGIVTWSAVQTILPIANPGFVALDGYAFAVAIGLLLLGFSFNNRAISDIGAAVFMIALVFGGYVMSTTINTSGILDDRCANIQKIMLRDARHRDDAVKVFEALRCRPQR